MDPVVLTVEFVAAVVPRRKIVRKSTNFINIS